MKQTRHLLLLTGWIVANLACNQTKKESAAEIKTTADPHAEHADIYSTQDSWEGACQRGKEKDQRQSPIALRTDLFAKAKSSALTFSYKKADADIIDNSHTLQVKFKGDAGFIMWEGKPYYLKQFHFHKTAEHSINGNFAAMEVHFVHMTKPANASEAAKAIALGFVVESGVESAAWQALWKSVPAHVAAAPGAAHGEKVLGTIPQLQTRTLVPTAQKYMVYEGSLTTPACDEIVTHVVSTKPLTWSKENLTKFAQYYKHNNRQLQPLGEATVRRYRWAEEK